MRVDCNPQEKMEALRKAYSEVILNTTREAAARIMVSDQNVASTKDEALSLLVRLKKMVDDKVAYLEMTSFRQRLKIEALETLCHEAEITSLSQRLKIEELEMECHETEMTSLRQRMKIEELEAQLHEAEDVVVNLREKLNEVEDKWENLKENQTHLFHEQIVKGSSASWVNLQAKKLDAFEAISSLLQDARSEHKDASYDQRRMDVNCEFASENATTPTKTLGTFPMENYSDGKADLVSILMTSKDSELYRNGCTQRIRAFDHNLLDRKLPLPVEIDVQKLSPENRLTIKEATTDEPKRLTQKNWTGLEDILGQDNSSDRGLASNLFRRFSLRKTKSRYRKATVIPCVNQVMQTRVIATRCKAYARPECSVVESGNSLSKITDQAVQKDSESHVLLSSLDNTMNGALPGSMYEVNVQIAASEEIVSVDKSDLSRKNGNYAIVVGTPKCWWDCLPVDVQVINDEKTIEAANSRLPRCSFRRKCNQGFLSWPDKNKCKRSNSMKKRSGHELFGAMCPPKSSLKKSSRVGRSVQVAHQLVSLSKKRRLL